jgi:PilZ domain/RDD family
MEAVSTPAQHMRALHRHELRTLTYVILDEANGGIIRNLTHCGATIQAVGALRKNQIVRLRFELRFPRVRVETRGEVIWANPSGQCGVRFFDLPPRLARQINEWIFGNLLESIPQHASRNIFSPTWATPEPIAEEDGLLVSSSTSRKVIPLPSVPTRDFSPATNRAAAIPPEESFELDWLSQPLSGRSLAWIVDSLIVVAASLLFSLVFLSVTHELPKWPMNLAAGFGAVIFVTAFYWGFFHFLAGASLGTRLARLTGADFNEDAEANSGARFR